MLAFAGPPGFTARRMRRGVITAVAVSVLLACSDRKETSLRPKSGVARRASVDLPKDSRFGQIKALLSQHPETEQRAYELYPRVKPVCTDEAERRRFIADAAAWVSVRKEAHDRAWARRKSIDTIEHVATACMRTSPEAAFAVLSNGKKLIANSYRFDVVTARLKAAVGELDAAVKAAEAAREAGSIHAIALSANIQAEVAREAGPGYRVGMLDKAIETVSAKQHPDWPIIDLTAVLTTRAHLLSERAVWEPPERRRATLKAAAATYERLGIGPYVATSRLYALDARCFDAVEIQDAPFGACNKAAVDFQNLGAGFLAGLNMSEAPYDATRLSNIKSVRARVDALPKGAKVLLIARGDEAELVSWARPSAVVLARLARREPALFVVDRTSSARAGALLSRVVELAGAPSVTRISAGRDAFVVPCVAALVAGRKKPKVCPLSAETIAALQAPGAFGVGLLVGRDLDAEIEDLALYDLPALLLSLRDPLTKKPVEVHMKNQADAWLMSTNAEALAGRFKAP
jgi:hypothetical protein